MKLRLGNKNDFDQWIRQSTKKISSQYGEDRIVLLDIEHLISNSYKGELKEIEVNPQEKIDDVIKDICGEPAVTITPLEEIEKADEDEQKFRFRHGKGSVRITERYLYCLAANTDELDSSKTLGDYDIHEGDILLLGTYSKVEPDPVHYRAGFIRDVDDFCRIVRTLEEIEKSPGLLFQPSPPPKGLTEAYLISLMVGSMFHAPGLRPIESVLLYTDEDESLAEYIRFNFVALDEMTGHHLNIYAIEQPTQVKGLSARNYWKAHIEESKFNFLHFMGWTQFKPYDKASAYKIAKILGIYPESLPCIVLFNNIKSDEKIIITVSGEEKEFFRKLSTITLRTMEKMGEGNIKLHDNFAGFRKPFLDEWSKWQTEQKVQESKTFVFNGNTVFINKPSGNIELKDFQKGD